MNTNFNDWPAVKAAEAGPAAVAVAVPPPPLLTQSEAAVVAAAATPPPPLLPVAAPTGHAPASEPAKPAPTHIFWPKSVTMF